VRQSNEYYRGNKLLESLSRADNFRVPLEGSWNLIYANESNIPHLHLEVYDNFQIFNQTSTWELRLSSLLRSTLVIGKEDEFYLRNSEKADFEIYGSEELFDYFSNSGLIVHGNYQGKPFNSKASSRYHVWQSKQRFIGGITDIDLIRLDSNNKPSEIIEIKRSRIPIDRWHPYLNDKGGYEILEELCRMEKIDLSIIYYHYDPASQIENCDQILVLKKVGPWNFKRIGVFSMQEYKNGDHLNE